MNHQNEKRLPVEWKRVVLLTHKKESRRDFNIENHFYCYKFYKFFNKIVPQTDLIREVTIKRNIKGRWRIVTG